MTEGKYTFREADESNIPNIAFFANTNMSWTPRNDSGGNTWKTQEVEGG
ncbi:MAG: hypothetical protein ACFFCW_02770 [Candidatus Hodarchaeota archaeon]